MGTAGTWDLDKIVLNVKELYESGHHNDGAGLNAKDAEWLGERLLDELSEGNTIEYQAKN